MSTRRWKRCISVAIYVHSQVVNGYEQQLGCMSTHKWLTAMNSNWCVCPLARGYGIHVHLQQYLSTRKWEWCTCVTIYIHSQVCNLCDNICPLASGNGVYMCNNICPLTSGNGVHVHLQQYLSTRKWEWCTCVTILVHSQVNMVYLCNYICPLASGNGVHVQHAIYVHSQVGTLLMCIASNICPFTSGYWLSLTV